MFRVAIVTLSDKGAAGQRADESGAVIREIAEQNGYEVVSYTLLPDEREQISAELRRLCDEKVAELVLTTAGRVFPPRLHAGGHARRGRTVRPRHRGGDALFELKHNEARDALPRRRGYPGGTLIVNLPGSPRRSGRTWNM
ncbi:MAG: molybdopterin-binding protein [Anaerotruncus massiliensis (ex Togo et al. 2019)]